MDRNTQALLEVAADLVRNDTSRLPRGTMANVREALENGVTGTGRGGRVQYRKGTVAAILDALTGNYAPAAVTDDADED